MEGKTNTVANDSWAMGNLRKIAEYFSFHCVIKPLIEISIRNSVYRNFFCHNKAKS